MDYVKEINHFFARIELGMRNFLKIPM